MEMKLGNISKTKHAKNFIKTNLENSKSSIRLFEFGGPKVGCLLVKGH